MKEARKNPGLNETCAINLFGKFDKNYSFANHKIFHLFSPFAQKVELINPSQGQMSV